jgi:BirA family transcriptional regulator, biotin operon repressor / biotin---[acetyl-CoA-carboxylase] ligase
MKLPASESLVPRLVVLPSVGSTNDELISRALAAAEPHFSVLVTTDQTSGKGRLGRAWVAPRGTALAISVLLRPENTVSVEAFGWLPLMAGVAMCNAVANVIPGSPSLKWPNDVLVDELKVCGLLGELLPSNELVIGAGVNLSMTAEQLPTETSTSLTLAGATLTGDELADAVLAGYLRGLRDLYDAFASASGDAMVSGLHGSVSLACATIGRAVRVVLPAGDELRGTAVRLDETGRLIVRNGVDGELVAVAAGDITHLRYE